MHRCAGGGPFGRVRFATVLIHSNTNSLYFPWKSEQCHGQLGKDYSKKVYKNLSPAKLLRSEIVTGGLLRVQLLRVQNGYVADRTNRAASQQPLTRAPQPTRQASRIMY